MGRGVGVHDVLDKQRERLGSSMKILNKSTEVLHLHLTSVKGDQIIAFDDLG